uniref:Protein SCAI n=1 Tax=Physcomitrium patens TaxID=3218 RepID=A0A7I4E8M4_PHYPA
MAPRVPPPNEEYRALVDKAYDKFARLREFPAYGRNKWDFYFHKTFQVYSKLWKFQQENRAKLVEMGLKRWEIGEIASRIGQLYYNYYLRTSDSKFLTESFIFYEAIFSREYFKEYDKDVAVANKQLRYTARFIVICLLLNRKETVQLLVRQFRSLVDEYTRTFNEIKFSELTLDTFRMLQAIEWEPSGLLFKMRTDSSMGSGGIGVSDEIPDPSLPPNPHKYILYRPTVPDLLLVLATACDELSSDGIVLLYISASGRSGRSLSTSLSSQNLGGALQSSKKRVVSLTPTLNLRNININVAQTGIIDYTEMAKMDNSDENSPTTSPGMKDAPATHSSPEQPGSGTSGLWLGSKRSSGLNLLYPSDILPFTRRPLFIIVDSDSSFIFESISGEERGEQAILLLSPSMQPWEDKGLSSTSSSSSSNRSGNIFTFFLTAPLLAFCQVFGTSGKNMPKGNYEQTEKLLATLIAEWGNALDSMRLDPVWARVLGDPFLRQLTCRFIFCRAVFGLHSKYRDKPEYLPRCNPPLPDELLPTSKVVEMVVYLLATRFGVSDQFDSRPSTAKKADGLNGSFKDETTTGEDFSAGEASEEEPSDDRHWLASSEALGTMTRNRKYWT